MNDLFGLPVYLTESLADRVQFRFPRSKKVRIRRKWARQAKNFKVVPRRECLRVGNSLHFHPAFFEEFCREADIKTVTEEEYLADIQSCPVAAGQNEWSCGGITRESILAAAKLIPKLEKPLDPPLPLPMNPSEFEFRKMDFMPRFFLNGVV